MEISKGFQCIGVREGIIEQQAINIGIPLRRMYVYTAENEEYELKLREVIMELKKEGIHTVAFGDIFLKI